MASGWATGRDSVSAVDPTYGQRSVFGIAGQATAIADEDLDVEDEQEALDYLRLVRAEAGKIPHVMIAPRHGPQAFPRHVTDSMVEGSGASKQKRRRRRRHWDEQDDGQSAAKRPCLSGQKGAPAELSYDDESEMAVVAAAAEDKGGEAEEGEEAGAEAEAEAEDGEEGQCHENENETEGSRRQHYYDHCLYENGVGDSRGYYQNGAYTAAPEPAALGGQGHGREAFGQLDGSVGGGVDAETARFSAVFREQLLRRFGELRTLLQQVPPAEAVATLPAGHDTAVAPLSTRSGAYARWLLLLQTTDPLPAQMAAMDRVSAFRLLRVLLRGLLVGGSGSSRSSRSGRFARWLAGSNNSKPGRGRHDQKDGQPAGLDMDDRTSRWLWAVLARLPDRGELGYVEVGYIRDVAKQAVMRLAHLSYDVEEGEVEDGGGEDRESEVKEGEDEAEDIAMDVESEPEAGTEVETAKGEPTKPVTLEDLDNAVDVDMHQRATLEMVLAVAGEFYGQRDLLAFRSPWPTSRAA